MLTVKLSDTNSDFSRAFHTLYMMVPPTVSRPSLEYYVLQVYDDLHELMVLFFFLKISIGVLH